MPLCASISDLADTKWVLDEIKRKNLFLFSDEQDSGWYRFHNSFLELLQLKQTRSGNRQALLHTRASNWFEQNDRITSAIAHALKSEDYERTVELIEKNLFK